MANKNSTLKKSNSTKKVVEKKPVKKVTVETKKSPTKKVAKEIIVTPIVETKEEVKKISKGKKVNFKKLFELNKMTIIIGVVGLLLIANIVLLFVGHKVQLENGKEVIASIDGKTYTAEDLFDSLKGEYGSATLVSLVDKYINEKELTDEDIVAAKEDAQEYIDSIKSQYESSGYEWEDVLAQYGYTAEEDLLNEYLENVKSEYVVKKYLEKDITDEEINTYYNDKIYGNYTVKHILIKPDTTDDMTDEQTTAAEEAAKVTAQEVITKLQNGEDWATLVSTYSEDDGSKEEEGLVENFTYGDMDESFFSATTKLKDNEYTTEPVKSEYGYHVILKISSTKKPSLKDSKETIIDAIISEKLESDTTLSKTTLVNIRKSYNLVIKDSVVKKGYDKLISE